MDFPHLRVDGILISEFPVAIKRTFLYKMKHILSQSSNVITTITINQKTTSIVSFTALLRRNHLSFLPQDGGNMITIDGSLLIKLSSYNMLS